MNGNDLLNGLSCVEDTLIEEAERKKIKKLYAKPSLAVVACFAAVAAAFFVRLNHQNNASLLSNGKNMPYEQREQIPNDSSNYTLYFNKASVPSATDLSIQGHFWENLTFLQAEKILPAISERFQLEGLINYSYTDGNTAIFNIEAKAKSEGRNDIKITIAPGEMAKCCIIAGEPRLSDIEGISIEAGLFKTDRNSQGKRNYIYYADFKLEETSYYVEFSGSKQDEAFFTSIIADIILGGKADLAIFHPTVPFTE